MIFNFKQKKSSDNLSSQQGNPQVFSAHLGLTSVFGMGTGVPSLSLSPENLKLCIRLFLPLMYFILLLSTLKNIQIN